MQNSTLIALCTFSFLINVITCTIALYLSIYDVWRVFFVLFSALSSSDHSVLFCLFSFFVQQLYQMYCIAQNKFLQGQINIYRIQMCSVCRCSVMLIDLLTWYHLTLTQYVLLIINVSITLGTVISLLVWVGECRAEEAVSYRRIRNTGLPALLLMDVSRRPDRVVEASPESCPHF